jgi:hypothetical protein
MEDINNHGGTVKITMGHQTVFSSMLRIAPKVKPRDQEILLVAVDRCNNGWD